MHKFEKRAHCGMQVRDLMMFIEGQRQVAEAGPDVGLQEGSISLPTPAPQPASQPSGSKRRAARRR